MSQVLALKYRPRRFEDLIGQGTISQTLSLALDSDRLSHAYLFSGLRGSGKTSTARIMSKALLCSNGPTSKPCEVCDNCKAANENKHIDIIEMDAASNRGIDDIKELIEHTKYKPSSAKFKVFIIDEVHMLTPQAFNALLKTLEEPPAFVKFILATTDPLKLPATILSRTQHFRFKKISQKDVIHHLSHILNLEQIDFEIEALDVLSRSGGGSLRDTLTMLDQAIIFAKGRLTTSAVTDMLGLIDPAFMNNMFDLILNRGDINSILHELEDYEAGLVIDEMTIYLRNKMLENDARFDILMYDRFFRILADAKQLLFLNSDSSFVLILTFSKMVEATNLRTINEIINEVEKIEVKPEPLKEVAPEPTPIQTAPVVEPIVETVPEPTVQAPITTEPVIQSSPEQMVQNTQTTQYQQTQVQVEPTPMPESVQVVSQEVQSIPEPVVEAIVSQEIPSTNQAPQMEQHNTIVSEPIATISLETPIMDAVEKVRVTDQEVLRNETPSIYVEQFNTVIKNIYERNYDLANCFENNFFFEKFENDSLYIKSVAEGECKKLLWKEFSHIRIFIEEVFGSNTQIEFIKDLAQQEETLKPQETSKEPEPEAIEEPSSMIEDVEMGNAGCVADMHNTANDKNIPAQREEQIEEILNGPMVNKIKELFDPKKIVVKSKV